VPVSNQWEVVKNRFFIIFKFNKKSIYLTVFLGIYELVLNFRASQSRIFCHKKNLSLAFSL